MGTDVFGFVECGARRGDEGEQVIDRQRDLVDVVARLEQVICVRG